MTEKQCPTCEGNGYNYDKDLGEFTGLCPECNGEGIVESSYFRTTNSFHVEMTIQVAEDAYFSDDIRKQVDSFGWGADGYPVQGDYLLHLISSQLDRFRADGISVQSIAVGKKVVYVNSLDLHGNNDQPTLF